MAAVADFRDGAGVIEGKAWPLISDGIYAATFLHHETGIAFGAPRVFLHFKIVTPGEYFGAIVYRAYRVKSISGKARKGAAFKVSRGSEYVREMATLLKLDGRLDRISPVTLRGKVINVQIEAVVRDHKQREIPPALRYSVIRRLVSMEAGT